MTLQVLLIWLAYKVNLLMLLPRHFYEVSGFFIEFISTQILGCVLRFRILLILNNICWNAGLVKPIYICVQMKTIN